MLLWPLGPPRDTCHPRSGAAAPAGSHPGLSALPGAEHSRGPTSPRPVRRPDSGCGLPRALLGVQLLSRPGSQIPSARPRWGALSFPSFPPGCPRRGPCGRLGTGAAGGRPARAAARARPSAGPSAARPAAPRPCLQPPRFPRAALFFSLRITADIVLARGELLHFNYLCRQSGSLLSSITLRIFILSHRLLALFIFSTLCLKYWSGLLIHHY